MAEFVKAASTIDIEITVVAATKMILRGVFNFSFVPKLNSLLCQAKIGDRVAVEMPNGDRIVAMRKSATKALIISAYNKYRGEEVVLDKGLSLLSFLSFSLAKQTKKDGLLTARDITTVK